MSGGRRGFRLLASRSFQACVRGLALAVASVAGLPLVVASVLAMVTLPVAIGVLTAPECLLAVRRLAAWQRRHALMWSGVAIVNGYQPLRPSASLSEGITGRVRRCRWLLADPATWRDLLWMLAGVPTAVMIAVPAAAASVLGLWALLGDVGTLLFGWVNAAPPGVMWQLVFLSMLPVGAAGLISGPRLLRAHARVVSFLLAPTRGELAAQVDLLTESRSQVVDASAAELRRVERDLHDGAQARLVSVGMTIGLAEQVVRDDPDLALSLLAEARAGSGEALSELRSLVRGIHPPVLAERGLAGAVPALALALPLPVDMHVSLPGRAPAPAESAVYFAIAEALANVVKHSGADRAWVQLEYGHGKLIAMVGDDGTGGAVPREGGGLRGVEQRLAAFDGVIAVTSPPGGPTLVTMELPCELSLART
jgi:signal transduction histidine kinase